MAGMGGNFQVNPVTGTASVSIPVVTSGSRGGFQPSMSINYNSGNGNGPFGLGWAINTPSITRRTDKGIHLYKHHL
jgi:plastocyanin domain-containing protein